jgi:hypothetical protein
MEWPIYKRFISFFPREKIKRFYYYYYYYFFYYTLERLTSLAESYPIVTCNTQVIK